MKKLLDALSSLKLFLVFAALLLIAFALGGVIPQGIGHEQCHEMFGTLGCGWVERLGLGAVFSSGWFLALLAGAGLNLLACTVKQWRLLKTRPGLFLSHLGVLLMFAGGIVHGLWAERGMLEMEKGRTLGVFTGRKGAAVRLPFDLLLKDFRIEYYEGDKHIIKAYPPMPEHDHSAPHKHPAPEEKEAAVGAEVKFANGAPALKIEKFYPAFMIGDHGPESAGTAPQNPAVAVRLEGAKKGARPSYLFAFHPDFHGLPDAGGYRYEYEFRPGRVKQYESTVGVIENGAESREVKLSVNSPFTYKGFRFYQSGFNPESMDYSTLQVSRDPSVPLIYAGFAVLMLGLTWAFRREF